MKRQLVSSKGETWEWEETPEASKAIHKLNNPAYAGDYQGPLYAKHPDISKLEAQADDPMGVGK